MEEPWFGISPGKGGGGSTLWGQMWRLQPLHTFFLCCPPSPNSLQETGGPAGLSAGLSSGAGKDVNVQARSHPGWSEAGSVSGLSR